MNSGLMSSKLEPPPLPLACIERPTLLASIDAAASRKLTVLAAPAGSGKSVLLGQWQRATSHTQTVAWLSLDVADNEPARFFAYLAGAVDRAVGDFATYPRAEILGGGWPVDVLALWLAQQLESLPRALCIAIDDFQRLQDPATARAFAWLVQRAPRHVRWLVCGRSLPELAYGELQPSDDVCIIDRQALSFDSVEILALGREQLGLPLSQTQADHIHSHTAGWIAGVKLALTSSGSISAGGVLTWPVPEITRYLDTTVLRQQPPLLCELLLTSSIAEHFNGELCNTLLGNEQGERLLEVLERSQLFLQPLEQPGWYRYAPLFREFLRSCLRREHAERIPSLHLAASRWYAARHMYDAALRHAFNSHHSAWCVELLARAAQLWLRTGELATLLHWTRRVSRAEILRNDVLATSYSACLILCRRFSEARAWLDDIERALPLTSERSPALRACTQTLELMLAVLSNDVSAHDGLAEIEVTLPEPCSHLTGTLLALQAYRQLRRCRFDQARRLALRARSALSFPEDRYTATHADMLIWLANCAQGERQAAAEICERMFATVADEPRSQAWANAAAAKARMHYEQNELSAAEALCQQALPLLATAATPETFTVANLLLARLHAVAGRRAESLRILESVHSTLEGSGDRSWLGHVCHARVCVLLANGERQRAVAVAEDFGLPQRVAADEWGQARDYDAAWERFGTTQALLLLEADSFDACRTLLGVLTSSAASAGFVSRNVSLFGLLTVCNWRAGNPTAAFATLNRALGLMPKFAFVRSAFDEAPGLAEVLAVALRDNQLRQPLPVGYLERFADLLGKPLLQQRPQTRAKAPMVEPLTPRETQILQLLARGLSNQQIGARLSLALPTVKWHLRNIFAKLNVPTRTGALARARELRIIE